MTKPLCSLENHRKIKGNYRNGICWAIHWDIGAFVCPFIGPLVHSLVCCFIPLSQPVSDRHVPRVSLNLGCIASSLSRANTRTSDTWMGDTWMGDTLTIGTCRSDTCIGDTWTCDTWTYPGLSVDDPEYVKGAWLMGRSTYFDAPADWKQTFSAGRPGAPAGPLESPQGARGCSRACQGSLAGQFLQLCKPCLIGWLGQALPQILGDDPGSLSFRPNNYGSGPNHNTFESFLTIMFWFVPCLQGVLL